MKLLYVEIAQTAHFQRFSHFARSCRKRVDFFSSPVTFFVGENPLDLTHKIYEATRLTAAMKEMENFCNRYVMTLRLKINSEGKFEIEIQK